MLDFLPLAPEAATPRQAPRTWDIFCQVIDNFGDIGVCWRAAAELAARGQRVRLWVDDDSALQWMAPGAPPEGLSVHPWPADAASVPARADGGAGDVVVEAFGCEIPAPFLGAIAQRADQGQAPVWLNLEYLSAEDYVLRCHRLPSPIMSGPAAGLTRWFFYPGFVQGTGSLLREQDLAARQQAFAARRAAWRAGQGAGEADCVISLFCYEPPALPQLLRQLQADAGPGTRLLVTPGRAAAAVHALPEAQGVAARFLAPCPQPQFDEMLWACDLNLVRGEDSLARALWAGLPLVWHIYPQHDGAHHAKLDAFLDWLAAPASLRAFHHAWNGMAPPQDLPRLSREMLAGWRQCVLAARGRLARQPDLIAQIQAFAHEKS